MAKRSKTITLVSLPLLATLTACSSEDANKVTKYDSYASLEDCAKEWEVKVCELKTNPNSGDLVWVGPAYSVSEHKPSYKNDEGQTVERKPSAGVHYMPIFIPHATPSVPTYTPQGPARPFVSSPVRSPSAPAVAAPRAAMPNVSAPSAVSRGGFGSSASSFGSSAGA